MNVPGSENTMVIEIVWKWKCAILESRLKLKVVNRYNMVASSVTHRVVAVVANMWYRSKVQ